MSFVQFPQKRFGMVVNANATYIGSIDWNQGENENQANGLGTICYVNGNIYHGFTMHNQTNGAGSLFFANGTIVHGNFLPNGCYGNGQIMFPNGAIYEGGISKNKPQGEGRIWFPDGNSIKGLFNEGQYSRERWVTSKTVDEFTTFYGSINSLGIPVHGTLVQGDRRFTGNFNALGKLLDGVYTIGQRCLHIQKVEHWGSLMCEGPPQVSTINNFTVATYGLADFFKQEGTAHLGREGLSFFNKDTENPLWNTMQNIVHYGTHGDVISRRFQVFKSASWKLDSFYWNVNARLKMEFDIALKIHEKQWEEAQLNPVQKQEAILALCWHGTKQILDGKMPGPREQGIFSTSLQPCLSGTSTGSAYGQGSYVALPMAGSYSVSGNYRSRIKNDVNTVSIMGFVGITGTSKVSGHRANEILMGDETFIDVPWTSGDKFANMAVFQDRSLLYPATMLFLEPLAGKAQKEEIPLDKNPIHMRGEKLAMDIYQWDRDLYELQSKFLAKLAPDTYPIWNMHFDPFQTQFSDKVCLLQLGDKSYCSVKIKESMRAIADAPTTAKAVDVDLTSLPDSPP